MTCLVLTSKKWPSTPIWFIRQAMTLFPISPIELVLIVDYYQ